MSGDFFDANVLVYLLSGDSAKADRAEALLRQGGTISVQVLNEIANVARRKLKMDWRELREFLQLLRGLLKVLPLTSEVHELGVQLAERYELSVYDAMIVSAASLAGCERVWSEDMQDGMRIGKALKVENPFR